MIDDFTRELILMALREDVGQGDITTEATIDSRSASKALIRTKEEIVLAGLDIAKKVFKEVDEKIKWEPAAKDGDVIPKGKTIATVSGSTKSLLTAERTALNFFQHLSGIATYTRRFVEEVEGTKTKILDTRKTLPAYRRLEKYAVKMGGGKNHRFGLYDQFLIKDNHITAVGSVKSAVERVLGKKKKGFLVEVEIKSLDELKSVLESYGIDVVMLDNFSIEDVEEAVKMVKGRFKLEVSGNITLKNVRDYAALGVDYISVGAITHSAPAADIHMKFV